MKKEIRNLINVNTPFLVLEYNVHIPTDRDNSVKEYELLYFKEDDMIQKRVKLKDFIEFVDNKTLVNVQRDVNGKIWEFNNFKQTLTEKNKKKVLLSCR